MICYDHIKIWQYLHSDKSVKSRDLNAVNGMTIAICLWLFIPISTWSSSDLSDRNAVQSWSTNPPIDCTTSIFLTWSMRIWLSALNLFSLCLIAKPLLDWIFFSVQVIIARALFLSYKGHWRTSNLTKKLIFWHLVKF